MGHDANTNSEKCRKHSQQIFDVNEQSILETCTICVALVDTFASDEVEPQIFHVMRGRFVEHTGVGLVKPIQRSNR